MVISPGLDFIARSSANLFLPCAFAYAALLLGCNLLALSFPKWLLIIASVALRLGYMLSKPWFDEYRNTRMARAHGAVLAPHIKEKHSEVAGSLVREMEHGYPGETFWGWSKKYGTAYRFSIGLDERYFTTEPDHVKSILATEFESFEKGPILFSELKSLLGTGVFNSDGDLWKFHRSITRPFFSRDRITDFDVFDRHSEDALKRAKRRLAEGYPIDFQDLVARFTLDSATEFLFKNDVHSLSAGLPYPSYPSPLAKENPPSFMNHPSNEFLKAFVTGQDIVARRTQLGIFWPLREMWGDVVTPFRKLVDKFVEPFMEKGFSEKGTRGDSEDDPETLLDYLVNKTSDREVIRDELINLLVAARDTTASLLSFSLYMIIEHPDMCRRLREEILTKIGSKRPPTVEDIREMKFLRAFLNEILRLYAVVPFNTRTTTKPVVLAPAAGSDSPIYAPANSMFIYSVFLMHRRTDLWGPDALEFDPDRFLDERVRKYLVPNPFIFCPFNAGPRICLGQQFAYNEASFFLIRLLQQFSSFSLEEDVLPMDSLPNPEWVGRAGPQGKDKIRLRTHLTLYIKGGLWVRMAEAAEGEAV